MIDWPTVFAGIAAIIGALGIRELIQGWAAKRTGEAQEEKKRMQELIKENDTKDGTIDKLWTRLRKQKEYSSQLRRKLIEMGVRPEDLPDWPREGEEEEK